MNKVERLKKIIGRYSRIAVAYSGGVDSTFLLYFIKRVAEREVIAFTSISETYTEDELRFAEEMAKSLYVKLVKIKTDEFSDKRFISNPINRCFYCKLNLFSKINDLKDRYKFDVIFDGTNYSDRKNFRPGKMARDRYNVLSPLELAKITKDDIRRYSKKFNIAGYDRPPNACLASRIPYGTPISKDRLDRIHKIERFIHSFGIRTLRVRDHNEVARIETSIKEFGKILLNRDKIVKKIKSYGFKFITLDIEGYRTGSMNK